MMKGDLHIFMEKEQIHVPKIKGNLLLFRKLYPALKAHVGWKP